MLEQSINQIVSTRTAQLWNYLHSLGYCSRVVNLPSRATRPRHEAACFCQSSFL